MRSAASSAYAAGLGSGDYMSSCELQASELGLMIVDAHIIIITP
jgi:hypothetical protein